MADIDFASGSMMEIAKSGRNIRRVVRRVVRMPESYAPGFIYSIVLLADPIAKSKFQSGNSVDANYFLNIHQHSLYMKTRFPVHLSARSSPHRHLHHLPRLVWRFSWLLLLL